MSAQFKHPIRLMVWGLSHPEIAGIVRYFREQPEIELVAWFGIAKDCTHEIFSFYNFQQDYDFRTPALTEALYHYIYQDLPIFMDMFSRHNRDAKRRPLKLYTYHDALNMFNRYVYFFADLVSKNNCNMMLFGSNVHEGPDFILYKICKFWGIETILLYQTLFPNRFMTMRELKNHSHYYQDLTLPCNPQHEHIALEKRSHLYYMSDLKQPKFEFSELKQVLTHDLIRNIRKKKLDEILEKARYLIKYLDYRAYKKNTTALQKNTFKLDVPYVYFPLHYQPEMTTSSLGGLYVDQLLALERLARLIPENWLIYTKEHIIQTEFMRGNWFFQRLKQIENVCLLPMESNTFELTEHAQFVSTITGTAGWEALKNGKNALIFGNVWYEGLPGVFQYHEDFKIDEILSYKINNQELEVAVNTLVSKMEEGVIESLASCLVENFDPTQNSLQVGQFLQKKFQTLISQKNIASPV